MARRLGPWGAALCVAAAGAAFLARRTAPALPPSPRPVPPSPHVEAPPALAADAQGLSARLDPKSLDAMRLLQARFNVGDYDKSLALAEAHLADASLSPVYRAWLEAQLPAILTSMAWMRIQTANCDDALPLLQRSLRLRETAEASKGMAICFFKAKRFYESDAAFRSYLESRPEDTDMKVLFSDALESLGDYEGAAAQLAEVMASPGTAQASLDREEMTKRLSSMRARAKEAGNQSVLTSEHFALTYRANEHEALADWVLETLETAHRDLQSEWGLKGLGAPLEVVLYPDDRFRNFVTYSPVWAGALFDGRLRIPVHAGMSDPDERRKLTRVLRHELSHAMLSDTLDHRRLPPWFAEGFAQLVECAGGCPHPGFPATPGKFLPASAFEGDFTLLGAAEADQAYRQSLYLILTLRHAPDLTNEDDPLRAVLDGLGKSGSLGSDAILAAAGLPFATLRQTAERAWNGRQAWP